MDSGDGDDDSGGGEWLKLVEALLAVLVLEVGVDDESHPDEGSDHHDDHEDDVQRRP